MTSRGHKHMRTSLITFCTIVTAHLKFAIGMLFQGFCGQNRHWWCHVTCDLNMKWWRPDGWCRTCVHVPPHFCFEHRWRFCFHSLSGFLFTRGLVSLVVYINCWRKLLVKVRRPKGKCPLLLPCAMWDHMSKRSAAHVTKKWSHAVCPLGHKWLQVD